MKKVLTLSNSRVISEIVKVRSAELKQVVDDMIGGLTSREGKILRIRLNGEPTWDEVGAKCGVSRATASSVFKRAVRKLSHPSRRGRTMKWFDNCRDDLFIFGELEVN